MVPVKYVPPLHLVSSHVLSFLYFTALCYDMLYYVMPHVGMRTRANSSSSRSLHSNSASERCVQRVRSKASETLRYTLFSIRCEMLWAASKILRVIAAMSRTGGGEDEFNFHQQHLMIGRPLRSGQIELN